MSDLTIAAAVYHSLAATAVLELYLAGRLVKLVELAGGVGASDELPGQLHVHPIVQSQGKLRYAQATIEATLNEEVDERALTRRSGIGVGVLEAYMYVYPRREEAMRYTYDTR